MSILQKYADSKESNSNANKWRRKRFLVFEQLIENLDKPVKILDVGGLENFWIQMGYISDKLVKITLLNTEIIKTSHSNIQFVKGDARDLHRYKDNEFDVVFSNSVIEHVGDFTDQKKMAEEIQRVGKLIYLQTPNYYFPIEPHFLFPLFQFFPEWIKIFLVSNFNIGWFDKCSTKSQASELVNSIKLLTRKQLKKLFPESTILEEKFYFFTKSFMVISK